MRRCRFSPGDFVTFEAASPSSVYVHNGPIRGRTAEEITSQPGSVWSATWIDRRSLLLVLDVLERGPREGDLLFVMTPVGPGLANEYHVEVVS